MNFFKNISIGNLFGSKTWWGALILAGQQAIEAYGVYKMDKNVVAFAAKLLTIAAALLATLGLIDRTAPPKVS
jgi:uncharacterized membrane protein